MTIKILQDFQLVYHTTNVSFVSKLVFECAAKCCHQTDISFEKLLMVRNICSQSSCHIAVKNKPLWKLLNFILFQAFCFVLGFPKSLPNLPSLTLVLMKTLRTLK